MLTQSQRESESKMSAAGYILPVNAGIYSQQWDPWEPDTSTQIGGEEDWVYIFLKNDRSRPTRVVLSYCEMGDDWDVGTVHRLYHAEGDLCLGAYEVVGIIHYVNGELSFAYMSEEVEKLTHRKIATAVFK